jgi:hypothetical protein
VVDPKVQFLKNYYYFYYYLQWATLIGPSEKKFPKFLHTPKSSPKIGLLCTRPSPTRPPFLRDHCSKNVGPNELHHNIQESLFPRGA